MEDELKPNLPTQVVTGSPLDLKGLSESLQVIGIGLLMPGVLVLWGYAYFDLTFTPRGLSDWFPILYASLSLTTTLIICLALTIFVGAFIATIAHGGFVPSRNKRGVSGFRMNGFLSYFLFWNWLALVAIALSVWLCLDAKGIPWPMRAPIFILNLSLAYFLFRVWEWKLAIKEDPGRGRIWNWAKPHLSKGLLFYTLVIVLCPFEHGMMHHYIERSLVMAGVRSDLTRLRISGTHLEPLRRKSKGKLDLVLTKEGDQSFLYIDRARILFQGLGTDALLELRMPTGKTVPYRLPSADFREIGYSDDEPPQG